jgi:hypothetical protein
VIALVENNLRSLQSNSAAVLKRFSDGNVPLNGQRTTRKAKERPTIEELREYLDYDPETGVLRWKKRVSRHVLAGAIAGSAYPSGYLYIQLKGARMLAHRVAFAFLYGRWPRPCCDHVNGNTLDNRACNLRECTVSQNSQNKRAHRNNKSGVKGVSWSKQNQRWTAEVVRDGKAHRKSFRHLEDAAAWVKQLRVELHGEFSRH